MRDFWLPESEENVSFYRRDALIPKSVWGNPEVDSLSLLVFTYLQLRCFHPGRAAETVIGVADGCGYSEGIHKEAKLKILSALEYWSQKSIWFKCRNGADENGVYRIRPRAIPGNDYTHKTFLKKCGGSYVWLSWKEYAAIRDADIPTRTKPGCLRTYLVVKARIERDRLTRKQSVCQCVCVTESDLLEYNRIARTNLERHLNILSNLGLLYILNSGLVVVPSRRAQAEFEKNPQGDEVPMWNPEDEGAVIAVPKCYCLASGTFNIQEMYRCCIAAGEERTGGRNWLVVQGKEPTLKAPPGVDTEQLVASIVRPDNTRQRSSELHHAAMIDLAFQSFDEYTKASEPSFPTNAQVHYEYEEHSDEPRVAVRQKKQK